jgi:hypothetical protein
VALLGPGEIQVMFAIVPQEDGTYGVEASDGELSEFLCSFETLGEAEAWIARLKGSMC